MLVFGVVNICFCICMVFWVFLGLLLICSVVLWIMVMLLLLGVSVKFMLVRLCMYIWWLLGWLLFCGICSVGSVIELGLRCRF